jgi:hypothetical protein
MGDPKMQFVLKGFSEVMGFRIFAFEGVSADWTRTAFTVKTDLALSRRYGIRLQELPLLCRAVLEDRPDDGQRTFTFGEDEMCRRAALVAEKLDAAQKKGCRGGGLRMAPELYRPAASYLE